MHVSRKWAVILAGGNGTRLHAFTRSLTGDDRPKQFCRLLGPQTLLGATRARLSSLVEPERTLSVVTRHHAEFYRDEFADVSRHRVVEQPLNCGTAPAIAYAIARVERQAPDAVVGLFPADHHYEDSLVLGRAVAAVYAAAAVDPTRVLLLGAEPDRAETDYGYILPSAPVPELNGASTRRRVRGVRTFVEKPAVPEAMALIRRGALWNTFVLVGHVGAFRMLFDAAAPDLMSEFTRVTSCSNPELEYGTAVSLYNRLPSSDFSSDVLSRYPEQLGVIALPPGNWTDLGQPSRVLDVMAARRQDTVSAAS